MKEIKLDNMPNNNAMWSGLDGNFDNLTEIFNEFIDNSISNLVSHRQEYFYYRRRKRKRYVFSDN